MFTDIFGDVQRHERENTVGWLPSSCGGAVRATRVKVVHDYGAWLFGPLGHTRRVRCTPVVIAKIRPADV